MLELGLCELVKKEREDDGEFWLTALTLKLDPTVKDGETASKIIKAMTIKASLAEIDFRAGFFIY